MPDAPYQNRADQPDGPKLADIIQSRIPEKYLESLPPGSFILDLAQITFDRFAGDPEFVDWFRSFLELTREFARQQYETAIQREEETSVLKETEWKDMTRAKLETWIDSACQKQGISKDRYLNYLRSGPPDRAAPFIAIIEKLLSE